MKQISTRAAPEAIGPYSQGITAGAFVFCSGQIGLVPQTGQMVDGGVKEQARQALENLGEVLSAAGSSFEQVVKTTVFLTSMDDYNVVNEQYGYFFDGTKPARSAVAVSTLPKNALVEFEAIAIVAPQPS